MTPRNRVITGLAVLLTLAGIFGYQQYQAYDERKQREKANEASRAKSLAIVAERAAAEMLARPDKDMAQLPRHMPKPASAWRSAEKAFYEKILTRGRFDLLVVPIQVQDHAFARDLRSLMTADLVMSISAAAGGKLSMPDPYLVARALGDGERRVELTEVLRLANLIGVSRILVGYVGHEKGEMRITLHDYRKTEKEIFGPQHLPRPGRIVSAYTVPSEHMRGRHFERLRFSDVVTPLDVFHRQLPAMIEFLGIAGTPPAAAVSRFEPDALPSTPLAVAAGPTNLARDAYYLQLLAALTPESADRVRERLVEKSMLAVLQMAPESPDYRVLKARALMQLGMRPAALQALGTPASAEEKHLLALLNGNLPDVQAARAQIGPGVRALIAALEENAVAAAYGVREQKDSLATVAALKLPGDLWPFLFARAMTDWDPWMQHDNIHVKAVLDREFPLEGNTAEALAHGASAIGDMWQAQIAADLSVLDHARRKSTRAAAQWCCAPLASRPSELDYLDLLEAIGTANLVRRVRFLDSTQGQPRAALDYAARLELTFKDHPQFAYARAHAEMEFARGAPPAEQEGLLKSAYATAYNVWYWEQGQTRTAAYAMDAIISRRLRADYGNHDNVYINDYPFRSFYPVWAAAGEDAWLRNAQAALDNSAFDFTPVNRIEWSLVQVKKQGGEFDKILASIEKRFAGNPRRVVMMAQSARRQGDLQASERYYRQGIEHLPQDEELYKNLGRLLFENAAIDRSAEVFMSYPPVKTRSGNPVGLSNFAFDAGSLYFWSGEFKLAVPFYRLAEELRTGSGGSIASATRLRLMDGDFAGALAGSLERARRYNSTHAYRDYFAQLHAMGQSQQAWDGFRHVMQIDAPHIWESALVGHRREGASEADILQWVSQEAMLAAGVRHQYAVIHLLRAAVTDRTPSEALAGQIEAIERPVFQLENQWRSVVRKPGRGTDYTPLGPNAPGDGGYYPLPYEHHPKRSRVKSELVYFAQAYRALRLGRFGDARILLEEASVGYDLRNPVLGYLLPYYAFASARAKDTAAVESLLAKFDSEHQRFDYHLAKAVLAGFAGKTAESIQHVKLAMYRRPFTENRAVQTEYQLAEICEWLFEATQQAGYRAAALDWARKNQISQPWFAWPYAVEARLSTVPAERGRAIAMAHYLDPKSERLARLPKTEVQQALREWGSRNPFLNTRTPKSRA